MKLGMLFAFMVAAVPCAAAAQDAAADVEVAEVQSAPSGPQQTVEGAQEFLRRITRQFSMANSVTTTGDNVWAYDKIQFSPDTVCTSNISSELTWRLGGETSLPGADNDVNFERYKELVLRGSQMDPTGIANWHSSFEGNRFPTSVDWSSVSSVETISSSVQDTTKRAILVRAQPPFVLFAPDEAVAKRMTYAMEFLRAACDQSAETGF